MRNKVDQEKLRQAVNHCRDLLLQGHVLDRTDLQEACGELGLNIDSVGARAVESMIMYPDDGGEPLGSKKAVGGKNYLFDPGALRQRTGEKIYPEALPNLRLRSKELRANKED